MRNCILCKADFNPTDVVKDHTPPFNCQICKANAKNLYSVHTTLDVHNYDTTDVCWNCDDKILKQHNDEYHASVDLV